MHFTQVLGAAVLGAGLATADFMVYTEPPIPTSAIPTFANPSQATSWTQNVFINARRGFAAWERGQGSTYEASRTSVQSQVSAFAASNANYSIPAAVLATDGETTSFQGAPAWYTALPSGVREFKEKQVSAEFSAVREQVSSRSASSAEAATRTSDGAAAAMRTPAKVMGMNGMGVGMAAVVAGVFL